MEVGIEQEYASKPREYPGYLTVHRTHVPPSEHRLTINFLSQRPTFLPASGLPVAIMAS